MRILYYDGNLNQLRGTWKGVWIDAKNGFRACEKALKGLSDDDTVITNSVAALSTIYGWDNINNRPDIYIYNKNKKSFVNIIFLTERELQEGHNIFNLYRKGEFD